MVPAEQTDYPRGHTRFNRVGSLSRIPDCRRSANAYDPLSRFWFFRFGWQDASCRGEDMPCGRCLEL
jgi:hypothetical protein